MKKYLNKLWHNITYPFGYLKSIHQRLLNTNLDDLMEDDNSKNPYQLFQDWILEIVEYGTLLTIVFSVTFGYQGFGKTLWLVIAFGIGRMLWLGLIKDTSEAIRGQ